VITNEVIALSRSEGLAVVIAAVVVAGLVVPLLAILAWAVRSTFSLVLDLARRVGDGNGRGGLHDRLDGIEQEQGASRQRQAAFEEYTRGRLEEGVSRFDRIETKLDSRPCMSGQACAGQRAKDGDVPTWLGRTGC
jgi:hypothetical protein